MTPSDETREYFENHPRVAALMFGILGLFLAGLSWYGFTHTDPYRSGACLLLAILFLGVSIHRFALSLG